MVLSVPGDLRWTSCRILLGRLIAAGMCRVAPCLVAMMGGCSLVLKKYYSIIVVLVNSVYAGASILSSGGVPAPFFLWCEVHLS